MDFKIFEPRICFLRFIISYQDVLHNSSIEGHCSNTLESLQNETFYILPCLMIKAKVDVTGQI